MSHELRDTLNVFGRILFVYSITIQFDVISFQASKNFVIVLRNPSQGSHLGENSAAVINMNFSEASKP